MRGLFKLGELAILPIPHIHVIHLLGKRMPIVRPFNPGYTMCEDVYSIRLIPLDYISRIALSIFTGLPI